MRLNKEPTHANATRLTRLALLLMTVLLSCADGPGVGEQAPPARLAGPGEEPYRIHVYVGERGNKRRVDFGAVDDFRAPGNGHSASAGVKSGPPLQPGLSAQGQFDTPDGTVQFDPTDVNHAQGWALLAGAAAECGVNEAAQTVENYLIRGAPLIPPWLYDDVVGLRHWFVFQRYDTGTVDSCDRILAEQEALLCMAQNLLEVADAVGNLHWEGTRDLTEPVLKGPWTIPPQSTRDRFIARDLATHVLAHVSWLETEPIASPNVYFENCMQGWAEAYSNPSAWDGSGTTPLFLPYQPSGAGSYYFPPRVANPTINDSMRAMSASRLNFKATILRTASQLLEKIVRVSVRDDVGMGERRRAGAGDPKRGNKLFWGQDSAAKYNSLQHATRVLLGRWEMGDQIGDPNCGGASPGAMLLDATTYGADISARYDAERVNTTGHKRAVEAVRTSGLVLTRSDAEGPIARAHVTNQLMFREALRLGIATTGSEWEAFKTAGQGAAIQKSMDGIPDADLRFALLDAHRQYRTLASLEDSVGNLKVAATQSAKAPDTHAWPDLPTSSIVLENGVPGTDLTANGFSRAGGMQNRSQCSTQDAFGVLYASSVDRFPFQDVFALGQTLRRKLVVLREWAIHAGLDQEGQPGKIAEAGAAEARIWAGPGLIAVQPIDRFGQGISRITILAVGFNPEDFGVVRGSAPDPLAEMRDRIVLVWGPPWAADCAARLRTACPLNFEQDYVAKPNGSDTRDLLDYEKLLYGADGSIASFWYDNSAEPFPTHFTPAFTGDPGSRLYLVLQQAPGTPAKGRVLGSAALRGNGDVTAFAVSDLQQELVDSLFGVDPGARTRRPAIGEKGLFSARKVCVEGAPWNPFVPLENELTSDSDQYENSWKHYLSLAAQAARRADELGQTLIDLGLQVEYRREAAGQELAAICGQYGAVDQATVDHSTGTIQMASSSTDQTLTNCLEQPKKNIVLLTEDILHNNTEKIKEMLGCSPVSTDPRCMRETLTSAGLRLVLDKSAGGPGASSEGCQEPALSLMDSLKTTGMDQPTLAKLATEPWLFPDALWGLASLTFFDAVDGVEWQLQSGGATVMNTNRGQGGGRWPGCLRAGATVSCDAADPPAAFDKLFRNTTGPIDDAELALIRWRIEGALWTLAALSKRPIPQMFDKYIPAADYNAGEQGRPAVTVFGKSRFVIGIGGQYWLDASLDDPQDSNDLGAAIPTTDLYAADAQEVPQWLRDAYLHKGRYRHVRATQVGGYEVKDGILESPGSFLSGAAAAFSMLKCTQFYGPGENATPLTPFGTEQVATLKAGGHRSIRLCSQPQHEVPFLTVSTSTDGASEIHLADTMLASAGLGYPHQCHFNCDGYAFFSKDLIPGYSYGLPDDYLSNFAYRSGCIGTRAKLGAGILDPCTFTHALLPSCLVDTAAYIHGELYTDDVAVFQYPRRMLLPKFCSGDDRILAFTNTYAPNGACGAASQVAQAVGLACMLSTKGFLPPPQSPPEVKSLEQLAAYQLWLSDQSRRAEAVLKRLYLEDIPEKVVSDIAMETVNTEQIDGEHGRIVLQMGNNIRSLVANWRKAQSDLDQLSVALNGTINALAAAQIHKNTALQSIAMQRISVHIQMTHAIASALRAPEGVTYLSYANAVNNAIAQTVVVGMCMQQLQELKDMEKTAQEAGANEMAQALNQLQMVSLPIYTDAQAALTGVQSALADTLIQVSQLRQAEQKAKYELAKGLGADFVNFEGHVVQYPVNTVLRRQYDITRRRYDEALKQAKYLAYTARLAIEQRIGARMETLTKPIGPLEPPHDWADDVCSLQGVDYSKLKTFYDEQAGAGPTASEEQRLIGEFADQYIGDYVAKLENFVEYYNNAFPSHEGDDTAVLSLREDLLGSNKGCTKTSPNLLLYSGHLDRMDWTTEQGVSVARGWRVEACQKGIDRCLRVGAADSLAAIPADAAPAQANQPPQEHLGGGVTWLYETDEIQGDAGSDCGPIPETGAEAQLPDGGAPPPPRTVWQSVHLEPGDYVLSWWDQARKADGTLRYDNDPAPSTLRAVIYQEGWKEVRSNTYVPYRPGAGDPEAAAWGERRVDFQFRVHEAGQYQVAFSISTPASEEYGSVAIANVQLERIAKLDAPAGPYIGTSSTRLYVAPSCSGGSAEELQGAFEYRCDASSRCFYELSKPFLIDTKGLGTGESRLDGRLAAGNFNYRHITVAVNLVGTGVHDCEGASSPACYGSAFIEYTLNHDAYNADIINHTGATQSFNFGSAAINHGKSLAAERYVTFPVSSADQGLLSQSGVEKAEFRGRPLDGSYRLRIWDSPGLTWNRLEDIQVILKYRYWSKLQKQPGSQ
jgi:hypothetical protein